MIVVGIRNPELRQNSPLKGLHNRRRTSRLMVVAEQMKNAVHNQVSQVLGEWLALLRRFASHRRLFDPRTEVPPMGLLGPSSGPRPMPHIYSEEEIAALLRTYDALLRFADTVGL